MDIKQAIDHLEYIKRRYCTGLCDEAMRMAIGTLRAQQDAEKNDLLTLDELREMDGQPVWIYRKSFPGHGCWKIIYRIFLFQIEFTDCTCLAFEGYSKDWLAYRRPPKEEIHER